ncbi:MAG TPA: sigma factor-like helix-turn-helix DNA-binding protein, partial [Bacteroidales bacterium]|nr:sigma factor-like helix-turn-helix DNA-binding protein [Bacteroidales bacterium]HQN86426.1 sigma factor-like helix-turn-helix DNA-binding protein [Bacteroidales bacterium]
MKSFGKIFRVTHCRSQEKFDLTRERVRQIKEKAIRRLKHNSRSKILKSYLG